MRKFYLFTLALLSAVGAWAQASFDGTKLYRITEITTKQQVAYGATGAEGAFGLNALDADGDQFNIVASGDGFIIQNTAGHKLGDNHNWNTTDSETAWVIESTEEPYVYALRGSKGYLNYQPTHTGSSSHPNCLYVDAADKTNSSKKVLFYITEYNKSYYTLIYNYQIKSGETRGTYQYLVADGDSYPSAFGLPYCVSATTPDGEVRGSDAVDGVITKEVTCTQNLPFTIGQEYNVKMHSSLNLQKFLKENGEEIAWLDKRIDYSNEDAYLWKFEGDAFGIKMVAKSGKVVVSTGDGVATLSGTDSEATEFVLSSSAANSAWFCLKSPNSSKYLNAQDGKIKHWSAADEGSSMKVFNISVDDAFNEISTAARFDIPEGSIVQGPGEFANPVEINSAIDAAKEVDNSRESKIDFMNGEEGQKLFTYIDAVTKHGSLANIQFTMKAQYATLIIPCRVAPVNGLKSYTCSEIGDNNVIMLTENGGDLAQNVPYIIKANPGDKFTIIGWDKGSRETHLGGLLTGVLTEGGVNIPRDSYVLAKNEDKVGFFKVTGDAVKCPQYKCYLTPDAGENENSARAFYFSSDDVETGINAVEIEEATPANAVIYDLSGRRVQSAKSGLYIVNGKKVIK